MDSKLAFCKFNFWPGDESIKVLHNGVKKKLTPGRKNLGLVAALVNVAYNNEQPESVECDKRVVTANQLTKLAIAMNWNTAWDLDPDAVDLYGLTRAIGDCLGSYPDALRLEKIKLNVGWVRIIPEGGITDAYLESIGIDPETCRHPLLHTS